MFVRKIVILLKKSNEKDDMLQSDVNLCKIKFVNNHQLTCSGTSGSLNLSACLYQ